MTEQVLRTVPLSLRFRTRGEMQRRVFGSLHHLDRVRPKAIAAVASYVYGRAAHRDLLNFWLIGSALEQPAGAQDLDLLLTPRIQSHVGVRQLESALLDITLFGIRRLGIFPDVLFRRVDADCVDLPGDEHGTMTTWRLESPRFTRLLALARPPGTIRRAGAYLIAIRRRLGEANYYQKLPRRDNGTPYLRPAVPLWTMLRKLPEADSGCPSRLRDERE